MTRHRNRNLPTPPSLAANRAAAEHKENLAHKLAQIQSLQAIIKKQAKQINRPAAMAMSAMTVTAGFSLLFLNKWSPFYSIYNQSLQAGFIHYNDKLQQQLIQKAFPDIEAKESESNNYLKFLEDTLYKLRVEPNLDDKANLDETLEYLDRSHDYSELKAVTSAKLVDFFNRNFVVMQRSENTPIQFREMLNKNIKKYAAKELFNYVKKTSQEYFEFARQLLRDEVNSLTEKTAHLVINIRIASLKIAVCILIQYLLIEPVLNRHLPYGIFQSPPPNVNMIPETIEQMDLLLQALQTHSNNLKPIAERHIKLARGGSLALVIAATFNLEACVNFLSRFLPLEYVMIIFVGMLATGLTDLSKDIYSLYADHNFKRTFGQQEGLLKKLLGKLNYRLTSINTGDLKSSQFLIEFEGTRELSAKTLALLLKNIFKHRGVLTSLRLNNTLIVPADCGLSEVAQLFEISIQREVEINNLRKQVKKILKCFDCHDYQFMPALSQADRLPTAIFEFNLPNLKDFKEKLIHLFINNDVDIEISNNSLSVIMKGYICAPDEELVLFCDELKSAIHKLAIENAARTTNVTQHTSQPQTVNERISSSHQPRQRDQHLDEKTIAVIQRMPQAVKLHRQFTWLKDGRRFTYDEGRNDNTVFPLMTRQFHNFRSFTNVWHFVTNVLVENKPPLTAALYKAFNNNVEAPALVAPEAEQGFVMWKGKDKIAKDQNGEAFATSLKLKLLGVFGNVRGYTDQQTAQEGRAVLHTLRGFKLNAH